MGSGSQATGRTCNDYSGSKVLKTVITKVLAECIIELDQHSVCHILIEQSKENAEVGRNILPYQ